MNNFLIYSIKEMFNITYLELNQQLYLLESCALLGYLWPIYQITWPCYGPYEKATVTNSFDHEYNKIWVMLLIALAICFLLFLIAYFFSFSTIKDSEKLSEYECGFEPFDNATRHPFDVHFYIVGILFLIFDVEIALLFPWVLSLYNVNWCSFYIMIIFLGLLTIGFFYEWHRGALVWPHQQYSTIFTDYKETSN